MEHQGWVAPTVAKEIASYPALGDAPMLHEWAADEK